MMMVLVLSLSMAVFLGMMSPQFLVFGLVIQAFLVALMYGSLQNIWISYIFFLVFLGGLLIVFVYVSSIIPKLESKHQIKGILVVLLVLLSLSLPVAAGNGQVAWSKEIMPLSNNLKVSLISSYFSGGVYLFIVGYLLMILWVVCLVVEEIKGPLRFGYLKG